MRVAMLLDNHHAPDRRVRGEAALLAAQGIEVRVIAWDRREGGSSGTLRWVAVGDAEELVRIEVPAPHGDGLNSIRQVLRFGWITLRNLDELMSDCGLVVAHDVYLLPLGRMVARRLKVPLAYDAHEEFGAMAGSRYGSALRSAVTRLESSLARRAEQVIVPGRSRCERWRRVGIDPLVLPNVGSLNPLLVPETDWDVTYCGMLTASRRIDLLIELAAARPDLRIAIAGTGAGAAPAEQAAREHPNLHFLGWVSEPDELLAQSRVIYYGLDPDHPYSDKACPNTLYQALRVGRPLVFFCGGEPAELLGRFDIGVRVPASADGLAKGVDLALSGQVGTGIALAREAVQAETAAAQAEYAARLASLARHGSPRRRR